jgi:ribonuclease VapC
LTLFVDASALVAMMTNEPGAFALEARLGADDDLRSSAIALWETTRAISTKRNVPLEKAQEEVLRFTQDFTIRIVEIGEGELDAALDAHHRYGKGQHIAKLNMGDCFAYACAKTNGAKLLYKGDDFSHTDLA